MNKLKFVRLRIYKTKHGLYRPQQRQPGSTVFDSFHTNGVAAEFDTEDEARAWLLAKKIPTKNATPLECYVERPAHVPFHLA